MDARLLHWVRRMVNLDGPQGPPTLDVEQVALDQKMLQRARSGGAAVLTQLIAHGEAGASGPQPAPCGVKPPPLPPGPHSCMLVGKSQARARTHHREP